MKISVCGKGGSGKSTIVSLLAHQSAARGFRTLVVDADESNAARASASRVAADSGSPTAVSPESMTASVPSIMALATSEASARVGKSRSTVANFLRLRQLPDQIKDSITDGTLSMGHARALLALEPE